MRVWHTCKGERYVTIPVGGHREHRPVASKPFQRWLAGKFYLNTKAVAASQAQHDAMRTLDGMAVYEGAEYSLHVRVAEPLGKIVIGLADKEWRAVEVSQDG